MSDFTCYMPHYDLDGNWLYEDCSETLLDYDSWSALRDHPYWHDRNQDPYNVYVHDYFDSYHGIEEENWWSATQDSSDYALYADYDTFECEDQTCEWVDCEDHEQYWDGRDCWKELCYGCDAMVCQLWYWDEEDSDWFTEDCIQVYDIPEYDDEFGADDVWEAGSEFDDSLELAQDTYCGGNFTCIEALGQITAQALDSLRVDDELNEFFEDSENQDLVETVVGDAEDAFDTDLEDVEDALDVDNLNQYENAIDEEMRENEDDSWFSQALEAFWRGFTGA